MNLLYILTPALEQIHNSLNNSQVFDPAKSDIELNFAATDYTQFSLLPKLINRISKEAPNIRLNVFPSEDKMPIAKLISGELDFVLGFSHEIEQSPNIKHQTWLEDSYCVIARKNHPQLKKGLTLDAFLHLSHVLISPWGEKQGIVDQQLNKQGLARKIALQIPSILAAPHTVMYSDLILTLPKIVAEQMENILHVEVYSPPISIPNYKLKIYSHKLNSSNASHRWLSKIISEI